MADLPNDAGKKGPNPGPGAAPSGANRTLSASVVSDLEALRNDVQQAHELAAEFQRQLAGKSNDFALLKQVFEKAREDLGRLNTDISTLREDRHRLANEAMKASAFQAKLAIVTAERDRLRLDFEVMKNAVAASGEDWTRSLHQRDKQIADLTVENTILKQTLAEAQRKLVETGHAPPAPPEEKSDAPEFIRPDDGEDHPEIHLF